MSWQSKIMYMSLYSPTFDKIWAMFTSMSIATASLPLLDAPWPRVATAVPLTTKLMLPSPGMVRALDEPITQMVAISVMLIVPAGAPRTAATWGDDAISGVNAAGEVAPPAAAVPWTVGARVESEGAWEGEVGDKVGDDGETDGADGAEVGWVGPIVGFWVGESSSVGAASVVSLTVGFIVGDVGPCVGFIVGAVGPWVGLVGFWVGETEGGLVDGEVVGCVGCWVGETEG
eukprot:Hpha_TRINITY_DN16908_c0_g11::TRINITY_DN16908_c0_g11_i2::g.53728::m.53728